jgi:hypothetical protein
MKDNVRVQWAGAGAVIEVDTAEGTLVVIYDTLPLAGREAYRLDLIPSHLERALQVSGANGCSWLCDDIDPNALREAGFRLVTGLP